MWLEAVLIYFPAFRIHTSKQCYIALNDVGGYELTLRGEMDVKVLYSVLYLSIYLSIFLTEI